MILEIQLNGVGATVKIGDTSPIQMQIFEIALQVNQSVTIEI